MKQPKKLTRAQKQVLKDKGLKWENWMLANEDNISWCFIHKASGKRRVILK